MYVLWEPDPGQAQQHQKHHLAMKYEHYHNKSYSQNIMQGLSFIGGKIWATQAYIHYLYNLN